MKDLTSIFRDGILVQVHVSFWSGARILRPEDLGLKPENIAETYKLGRKFLIPERVIREFRRIEGQARSLVEKNSYDFPFGNARFVTRRSYRKMIAQLLELQQEYMALADSLVARYDEYRREVYPIYKEAAEKAWLTSQPPVIEGSLEGFEAAKQEYIQKFLDRINSYYPQVQTLKEKFSLVWNEYEIAAPRMRETDTDSLLSDFDEQQRLVLEARSKIQNKIEEFIGDVVKVLRTKTTEICGNIATAIKEGRIIKSSTIDSLKDFIERFRDMNFVGDQSVSAQLDTLKNELLDAHPSADFANKENKDLREELSRKLLLVVEEAGKIAEQDINAITGDYSRKVNWEE